MSSEKKTNALILLFNTMPKIDCSQLAASIAEIEPVEGEVSVNNLGSDDPQQLGLGLIEFEDHQLQLFGLDIAVPQTTIEHTIGFSEWRTSDTDPMRQHTAHILCFYEGSNPDPVEQIIALYKVASCFLPLGLLGVLDETAWNCIPSSFFEVIFKPGSLDRCREVIPMGIWNNVVKVARPNGGIWICSKGNHRFGVQDFAYLGEMSDFDSIRDTIASLFYYSVSSGITFTAGETAQIGDRVALRFSTPIEFQNFFDAPLGTLVIQKIDLP